VHIQSHRYQNRTKYEEKLQFYLRFYGLDVWSKFLHFLTDQFIYYIDFFK